MDQNYISIPYYVWVGLGIIAGVVLLYFLCLKLSVNDWIGSTPPGPRHAPYFGCLWLVAGLASPLPAAVSRLLLVHGAVVRLCVCRVKILVLDGAAVSLEDIKAGRLIDNRTLHTLLDVVNSLGIAVPKTSAFLEECHRIMQTIYNYKVPIDDFREMLEDIDNYHKTQEKKKIEKLLFECTKTKVVLDAENSSVIEECSREIEFFNCTLRETPKMYFPMFRHFPWYMLQRKRIYKSLLKVKQKLCEVLEKNVKNLPSDKNIEEMLFFLYIFLHVSTSQKKSKPKSKPSKHSVSDPDAISLCEDNNDNYNIYDICGVQIFKTTDYVKICNYNIPKSTWLLLFTKSE